MYKKLFFLIFLPFLLIACSKDELESFHITLDTEADAVIGMGLHSAEVTINGYARWIEVGIVGNIDSYTLSDNIPDWLTISNSEMVTVPNCFRINVSALSGNDPRIGKVGFTVFKDGKSQTGFITVIQNPNTPEDMKRTENIAMKKYLSGFNVVDVIPAINEIKVDSVAPFYKLNPEGTVYMQVVKMGAEPVATSGEKIYFRYLRYNLLSYLENGALPDGQGNLNSATQDVSFFELGSDKPSTIQWGAAIQMPMLLGLPVGSEVNLVVASEAGLTSEISSVTPFLYRIRYFRSLL